MYLDLCKFPPVCSSPLHCRVTDDVLADTIQAVCRGDGPSNKIWGRLFRESSSQFSLNRPHWADSVIESPCPSVCAIGCSFWSLRSHHQFPGLSLVLPPSLIGNLETRTLGNFPPHIFFLYFFEFFLDHPPFFLMWTKEKRRKK